MADGFGSKRYGSVGRAEDFDTFTEWVELTRWQARPWLVRAILWIYGDIRNLWDGQPFYERWLMYLFATLTLPIGIVYFRANYNEPPRPR